MERALGKRAFLLAAIEGDKSPVTIAYDNHNVRTVFRRRRISGFVSGA